MRLPMNSKCGLPRLGLSLLLFFARPLLSGLGVCFHTLVRPLTSGHGLLLHLGFLLVAIYSRAPTNLNTLRSFKEPFQTLQHSFWFFLRSRHQTFQGVQQWRFLTYLVSSLFLLSFLGLLLAHVSRGGLLPVRRLGFPKFICSQAFSGARHALQAISPLSVFFHVTPCRFCDTD